MTDSPKFFATCLVGALLALAPLAAVRAAELSIEVEIPRLDVAEYHRPYVAAWLESPDGQVAAQLSVWYDIGMRDNEGTKWLKDLRQWWRRGGRDLDMPVDGLSAATRPVGRHPLKFDSTQPPLAGLAAGDYRLMVEASREVGGRELLQIDFQWPPTQAVELSANGERELGALSLKLKP
ncbi:DUF2271 domain-containing protein [uncultured Aquimonas sp.]|jgi:hypothetical protein|uniref:DUF2271 domain-containing protein n=1 Tax=uncultured Aquimonas sp. TaxID=385483 RepID=UPI00086ADA47|nr:DUF2271 domain-containing protein [uncultured Aquimonas sp.]ODU47912.1 MAG: hypothetical protein ABS96_03145 [Xanthomonadaceae bacterium SCN 69-123]